ncbi:hypothetical protein [Peptostreptococcus canis]|uniref:hypothetical protein n=1 Tax=Peptostreptococcus canis TaxID=1159213 RepID=UPI001AE312C8|nr:hypothetical protein [Peptostreptococcus canis]
MIKKRLKKISVVGIMVLVMLMLLPIPIFISVFLNWREYGGVLDASSYDKWMGIYSPYFGVIVAIYTFSWREKIHGKKENSIVRSRELNIMNKEIDTIESLVRMLIKDLAFLWYYNKKQEADVVNNYMPEFKEEDYNKEMYGKSSEEQKMYTEKLFDESFEKIDKLRILGIYIENSTYIYNAFDSEEEKFVYELKKSLNIYDCIDSLQHRISEIYGKACILCHTYCDPCSAKKYEEIYSELKVEIVYLLKKLLEYNRFLKRYLNLDARNEYSKNMIIKNFKKCVENIEEEKKIKSNYIK